MMSECLTGGAVDGMGRALMLKPAAQDGPLLAR
jgi:hypothetical protein